MFTIDDEKMKAVVRIYNERTGDPATDDMVRDAVLNYDWHNADEHQNWLNTTPVNEIVDWLAAMVFEENSNVR